MDGVLRTNRGRAVWLGRAALLGCVAGLRTMVPFGLMALAAVGGEDSPSAWGPRRLLRRRPVRAAVGLASFGEAVADKLPGTPSRIAPGPLGGRLVFGGLAGAALSPTGGPARLAFAAAGAGGAALGSFGGYHARKAAGERTGVPDPVWALAEDGLAVGLGLLATRPPRGH